MGVVCFLLCGDDKFLDARCNVSQRKSPHTDVDERINTGTTLVPTRLAKLRSRRVLSMSLHYVPDKEGLIKIGLTLEEVRAP